MFFSKNKLLKTFFIILILAESNAQIILNSVDDAVNFGISNSDSLKTKNQYVTKLIKNRKLSIEDFLPQLDFSWNEFDSININASDTRTKSISLNLNQLIFDNGKTRQNYLADRYNASFELLSYKQEINEYVQSIQQNFYDCILQFKIIELLKDQLQTAENDFSIMEYQYKNGLIVKSDYLNYSIACQEIRNSINQSQQKYHLYLSDLKTLLNISTEMELIIPETIILSFNENEKLTPKFKELEKKYISADLTLQHLQNTINFNRKQIKLKNTFFIPSIYINAGISFKGKVYPLTQPDYSIKLIFKFSDFPFFSPSYSNDYLIKGHRLNSLANTFNSSIKPELSFFTARQLEQIQIQNHEAEYERRVRQLKKEITQMIFEHDNLIDYIELLNETLNSKKEKLEISKFLLSNGLINSSDYIKEQTDYAESQQNLLKLQLQKKMLRNKIDYLTKGEL